MKSERIQLCSNTDNLAHRPKIEAHCGGEPKAWQPSGDEAVSAKYATHGQIAAPFGLAMTAFIGSVDYLRSARIFWI